MTLLSLHSKINRQQRKVESDLAAIKAQQYQINKWMEHRRRISGLE